MIFYWQVLCGQNRDVKTVSFQWITQHGDNKASQLLFVTQKTRWRFFIWNLTIHLKLDVFQLELPRDEFLYKWSFLSLFAPRLTITITITKSNSRCVHILNFAQRGWNQSNSTCLGQKCVICWWSEEQPSNVEAAENFEKGCYAKRVAANGRRGGGWNSGGTKFASHSAQSSPAWC